MVFATAGYDFRLIAFIYLLCYTDLLISPVLLFILFFSTPAGHVMFSWRVFDDKGVGALRLQGRMQNEVRLDGVLPFPAGVSGASGSITKLGYHNILQWYVHALILLGMDKVKVGIPTVVSDNGG